MTIDAKGERELQKVNPSMKNEGKRTGDGILGDMTSTVKEEELRINRSEADGKEERLEGVKIQGGVQVHQQQQSQGSAVLWERFLHIRSIKVLLVENDDSTRHVVAALLRNLSYEVIVAANGLQAWKYLEDITNHIDLILTEVVMPCLSGIGLLCKIMSHKTRKTIPVIMMSSHDSMGLVFKCLSKGAVDFLVKPIRKNELKNLWQHIWRRCHSSSGSGSESGTQTQKSVKSKCSLKSDNNSSSDDEDDNESTDLNVGDGSEDGSSSQTSWTKEVDSSLAVTPWDQIAKCPDSTCAQVNSNANISNSNLRPVTVPKENREQGERIDNLRKGSSLVIGKPQTFELRTGSLNEVPTKHIDTCKKSFSNFESSPDSKRRDKGPANHSGEYTSNKNKTIVDNIPGPQMDSKACEALGEPAKVLEIKNKHVESSKEEPEIELSLKRIRGVKDTGKTVQSDRNVLRRSEISAFSRYNTTSNACKAPNGINGVSSLVNDGQEIVKNECASYIRSYSSGNLRYPSSDGVSNNINTGSITDKLAINPVVLKDKLEAGSTINELNPSSAFKPIKLDVNCPTQQVIIVKADDMASAAVLASLRGSPQELPVQHIHHHHHVHHFHSMDRQPPVSNDEDLSLKKLTADAPFCGSSVGPVECNPANYSLNKSTSGSKHGSNGQNGSSSAVHAGRTNVDSDAQVVGKSGSGDATGSGSGNRVDQNKAVHRVAALTEFRQKKKERRSDNNKVRYENRKRLAEQRPRVRGQFVRRTGKDGSNDAADG